MKDMDHNVGLKRLWSEKGRYILATLQSQNTRTRFICYLFEFMYCLLKSMRSQASNPWSVLCRWSNFIIILYLQHFSRPRVLYMISIIYVLILYITHEILYRNNLSYDTSVNKYLNKYTYNNNHNDKS